MVKVSSDKVLLALMLVNVCCCCYVETNFAGKELNIDKPSFQPSTDRFNIYWVQMGIFLFIPDSNFSGFKICNSAL